MGLIQVKSGRANAEKIEEELKHLFDKTWQWRVRQISDSEYLAAFSRSNGIELALHNILATVTQSNMDIMASSALQEG